MLPGEGRVWSNRPESGFGENVNCEAGLKALPEKAELEGSVTALDSNVALWERGYLYPLISKSVKLDGVSLFSFADAGGALWSVGE